MKIENIYKKDYRILESAHGGEGKLISKEILSEEFKTNLNFLHYTVLPPKTSIGLHLHIDTEEVYIVLEGKGNMQINDMFRDVEKGDVILVNQGDKHGLTNNSDGDIAILVFECAM